jgi:hypothetical protein
MAKSRIKSAGNGLFASVPIQNGELIVLDPVVKIDDEDWQIIKNTRFVKMMGLRWINNQHVIPIGRIEYKLSPEDAAVFAKTKRWRYSESTGVIHISSFLLSNHSERPNAEEVIDTTNNVVGLRALRFIDAGEEIVKKYAGAPAMKTSRLSWDS